MNDEEESLFTGSPHWEISYLFRTDAGTFSSFTMCSPQVTRDVGARETRALLSFAKTARVEPVLKHLVLPCDWPSLEDKGAEAALSEDNALSTIAVIAIPAAQPIGSVSSQEDCSSSRSLGEHIPPPPWKSLGPVPRKYVPHASYPRDPRHGVREQRDLNLRWLAVERSRLRYLEEARTLRLSLVAKLPVPKTPRQCRRQRAQLRRAVIEFKRDLPLPDSLIRNSEKIVDRAFKISLSFERSRLIKEYLAGVYGYSREYHYVRENHDLEGWMFRELKKHVADTFEVELPSLVGDYPIFRRHINSLLPARQERQSLARYGWSGSRAKDPWYFHSAGFNAGLVERVRIHDIHDLVMFRPCYLGTQRAKASRPTRGMGKRGSRLNKGVAPPRRK